MNVLSLIFSFLESIGTVGTCIVSVFAIKRQFDMSKAREIENKRPRFAIERTNNIRTNYVYLFQNSAYIRFFWPLRNKIYCLGIRNISQNNVYRLKIKLIYRLNNRDITEKFKYEGLIAGQELVIVPSAIAFKLSKITDLNNISYRYLNIQFLSSANEIGICQNGYELMKGIKKHSHNIGTLDYFFVKGKNKFVDKTGDDAMIEQYDVRNKEFENQKFISNYVNIDSNNIQLLKNQVKY